MTKQKKSPIDPNKGYPKGSNIRGSYNNSGSIDVGRDKGIYENNYYQKKFEREQQYQEKQQQKQLEQQQQQQQNNNN
eukprot:gene3888-4853_t